MEVFRCPNLLFFSNLNHIHFFKQKLYWKICFEKRDQIIQRLMISSMLKPVVDGIGATAECCWDDLTLSCKRYSEMLCLCWDNAEISSDDNNDAEFCWVELRWWWYLLLRTLFILVLPNSGDKNGNFELSSPMVVTSTSASLSSLDSVRWDPVAARPLHKLLWCW